MTSSRHPVISLLAEMSVILACLYAIIQIVLGSESV